MPDRIVFWTGGIIHFIETKRPGKDAEEHQAREHERLRKLGADVRVLNTIEKVDAYIREMVEWLGKSIPRARLRR